MCSSDLAPSVGAAADSARRHRPSLPDEGAIRSGLAQVPVAAAAVDSARRRRSAPVPVRPLRDRQVPSAPAQVPAVEVPSVEAAADLARLRHRRVHRRRHSDPVQVPAAEVPSVARHRRVHRLRHSAPARVPAVVVAEEVVAPSVVVAPLVEAAVDLARRHLPLVHLEEELEALARLLAI